jgi:hypothetical protein
VAEGIDAWLAAIEMLRWDPFGVAIGAFSGIPAAGFDESMVGPADEREVVHVGGLTCGVVVDVVDFAELVQKHFSLNREDIEKALLP